ncbi:AAA family ATPase [Pseudomonas sp. R9.37]|uniref:AAA family ATPase n=1 Tax=Pseudomonas sp. R9.37 TaxID=1390498 RepID=UPI000D0CBC55|nr:AAA family ATPase [Pseudomonas sp. R9.37]PSL91601.1 ATP-binding protein [Pseudomonas sp. R9.37]
MELNFHHSSGGLVQSVLKRIEDSTARKGKGKFTYIIGNNGSGKIRVLGALSEMLETKQARNIVACIASSIHDRFRYGDHGNVKYMGARNARNAVFLTAIERDLSRYILQAMLIDRSLFKVLCESVDLNITFSIGEKSVAYLQPSFNEDLRDATRLRNKAAELGLLRARPLGMLNRIAQGGGRFDQLSLAQIPALIAYLDANIEIKLKIENQRKLVTDFEGLSTGEQNRLLMFAKILSVMEERTVFLIDEPELSLHLHWQMEFHKTLVKILSRLDRFHVVIATHSPIMISEGVRADGNLDNVVAVLDARIDNRRKTNQQENHHQSVSYKFYSFVEVASHEQLVLRQFHTSPYQTREVSVEIADTVLDYAEGATERAEAIALLRSLSSAMGLSEQAEKQIQAAIQFVRKGLTKSIKDKISI